MSGILVGILILPGGVRAGTLSNRVKDATLGVAAGWCLASWVAGQGGTWCWV